MLSIYTHTHTHTHTHTRAGHYIQYTVVCSDDYTKVVGTQFTEDSFQVNTNNCIFKGGETGERDVGVIGT